MSRTMLHLSKQNLKFSAAHFLIFDKNRAERLHGHNYQVSFEIGYEQTSDQGYFIDFSVIKKITLEEVLKWDEYTLLPGNNPEMKITEAENNTLKVVFRDRHYQFPKNEVRVLQVTNTSVEQLSELLGNQIYALLKPYGITSLTVKIEETSGQGASWCQEV